MSASRASTMVRGLTALSALVVLTVAVPLWLWQVSGSPIPNSVPTLDQAWSALTSRDDGTLLLGLLKYAAWAGWALFVVSVAADLVARLRGLPLPTLGPQQQLASQLIGAVAALSIALPTSGTAVGTPAAAPTHTAVAFPSAAARHGTTGPMAWQAALAKPEARPDEQRTAAASFTKYTVRPGDCLWDIAWNELGDPERWPELYEASHHIRQPGGLRITDPDHIEPGWTVHIPAPSAKRRPPSAPSTTARRHDADSPGEPVTTPLTAVPPLGAGRPSQAGTQPESVWVPPSSTSPNSTSSPRERISTPLSIYPHSQPQAGLSDDDWNAALAQHDRTAFGSSDWRARIAPGS